MSVEQLESTATALVAPGQGILAADEDPATLADRFAPIGVQVTTASSTTYRNLLFGTPGIEAYLSGVILYDDALRQGHGNGARFSERLAERGILTGINADGGPHPLAGSNGEFVTEGLDGLGARLAEWRALGARFTKWRAAIRVGDGLPSRLAIAANAEALARYAALSQAAGLVPLVEPDVMMSGTHDLAACAEASEAVWAATYAALRVHRVLLEGTVLKTNMVLPGVDCPRQASVEEVARATVRSLRQSVPAAVPGVAFLSGGQSDLAATRHLDAMNRLGTPPWALSFCYGRAIQQPVLEAWRGDAGNTATARAAFAHRCRMNGLARDGHYTDALEAQRAA